LTTGQLLAKRPSEGNTPIVEVLVEERTQLFFDGAAQDNAVCHRIVVNIVKAQAGVIGQSATRCGKRGNKTGNLRLLSVFIPLRVLRKIGTDVHHTVELQSD
jgi:hypothetical protein